MTRPSGQTFFRVRGFIPLGIVVGLGLLYFSFFFDARLKGLLEGYFSRLNGAPVAIGTLRTNFFRGEITLKNIEAWTPDEDTLSLKIGTINLRLNLTALLARKIIVEEMSIDQVGIGQASTELTLDSLQTLSNASSLGLIERVANGFQSDLKKQMGENPFRRVGLLLSGLDLSVEVQKKAKHLASLAKLDDYDVELSQLDKDLKTLVDAMPGTENWVPKAFQEGGSEAAESNDAKLAPGELEKLAAAEAQIQEHWKKVDGRFRQTENSFRQLRDIVDSDIAGFTKQLNLPKFDGSDLTPALAENTLAAILSRLNYWVDYSRRKMVKGTDVANVILSDGDAHSGMFVHFGTANAQPTFWLKKATISSSAVKNPKDGEVKGEITDVTSDPAIVGKPAHALLTADFPAMKIRGLKIEGGIDHVKKVNREWLNVHTDQLPVSKLAINEAGDLGLWLKSANLSLDLNTEFKDDTLRSYLAALFDRVEFSCTSRYKRIEETILGSLTDLPRFNLVAQVEGPFDHVKVTSTSEVGKRMGEALARDFKHQTGAIEDDLRKNILDIVYPRHQKQIQQLSAIKEKWLAPVNERLNFAQALRRRAEKLIARSKPRRAITAVTKGNMKTSSQSPPLPARSN